MTKKSFWRHVGNAAGRDNGFVDVVFAASVSKGVNMKTRLLIAAIVLTSVGTSASAYAEPIVGKTRAQVYEELIEAQRNGLRFITNVSYPDVAPMYAARVQQLRAEADKRAAERTAAAEAAPTPVAERTHAQPDCEGPISFCTPYFGS